jgi:hypothetical protein
MKSEAPGSGATVTGLRTFAAADVPAVADLIWRVLHNQSGPAPASMREYLGDLFLHNPWPEDGIVSRVYRDAQGKIVGFFGAVPRRMSFQGKTIRLAFGSNFVMDPESRTTMAAIQLVRTFMKGPQDISITDSANEGSRQLLRSLGFTVVPIYSLQWARPLRPSQYAVTMLSRFKKSRALAVAGAFARPFCALADRAAARLRLSPYHQCPPETNDEELSPEGLLECLHTIPGKHGLLPEYSLQTLTWVLDFVARRKVFAALRKGAVRNVGGKIVGWYIYSGRPGMLGDVLQIGAEGPSTQQVLDHLFYDAWKRGLIGLHGRFEPQFMQELTMNSCFFMRSGSWTLAHSKNYDLLAALQSGTAFFSRLDGEWCLRHGSPSVNPL